MRFYLAVSSLVLWIYTAAAPDGTELLLNNRFPCVVKSITLLQYLVHLVGLSDVMV